eukprot:TRINITY_DN11666_c0_g1_i2.p1 TRINITY_DN11666_c0_g1~~TRINITY_DN11666_c0_g1_i2.p1  ORF type:complete len:189 (-),score=35.77 TRINITY_DN11666_c0_g1_i2:63-629(-)
MSSSCSCGAAFQPEFRFCGDCGKPARPERKAGVLSVGDGTTLFRSASSDSPSKLSKSVPIPLKSTPEKGPSLENNMKGGWLFKQGVITKKRYCTIIAKTFFEYKSETDIGKPKERIPLEGTEIQAVSGLFKIMNGGKVVGVYQAKNLTDLDEWINLLITNGSKKAPDAPIRPLSPTNTGGLQKLVNNM